jgi:hypothetical protein
MISWFASRMAHTDKGVVRYGDLDVEIASWDGWQGSLPQVRRQNDAAILSRAGYRP